MSELSACRLCSVDENDPHMNIFSDIGIQLKMSEIIAEHFKCDISESDSLPNVVCQNCWNITEAFHDLYQKSKLAQEKFLRPLVKRELDAPELCIESSEPFVDEEQEIDFLDVKKEPIPDDHDVFWPESDFEDNDSIDEVENTEPLQNNGSKTVQRNKVIIWASKKREAQYQKLFDENKHRFDMNCDKCASVFETLDEARRHYVEIHNIPNGYIKCCGNKLGYRCLLVKHLERHLNPEKHKCALCGKIFTKMSGLEGHMKTHLEQQTKEKKFCDICRKPYTTINGLERHMRKHETQTDLDQHKKIIEEVFDMKCDHCDFMFTSLHDARYHYKKVHNEEKGYIKCCNLKFQEMWTVTEHINSHLNPTRLKCDLCGKTYARRILLYQHKRRHTKLTERKLVCDICGEKFENKENILRHFFTVHNTSEPRFECEICHKRFQLERLLKTHVYAVHRDKKPSVTCEICGKSFYTNFHLNIHMRTHIDKSERLAERTQCKHCGEWLMSKSGIYYHQQIHTSGVQKCQHCDMELPNKLALQGHIRKYHRERNHKCGYCERTFSTKGDLKHHEESHTRHKQYPCKFCSKIFTVSSSRQTHIKRNHKEEQKECREQAQSISA